MPPTSWPSVRRLHSFGRMNTMSDKPASYRFDLDASLFRSEAISRETRAWNEKLRASSAHSPDWWQVGVPEYREAAAEGKGPFPRPPKSAAARTVLVPAKDGHTIPLRVIAPPSPRGVYLFMHGGGLVFGGADVQDPMLERVVNATGMVSASIEYRLAPEHRYPAAWDDCETVALWLLTKGASEFGSKAAEALTIGGESAGAGLAVATLVRMRDRHGYSGFRAASLSYGNYDAGMTPSQRLGPDLGEHGPVNHVAPESLRKYVETFLPPGMDPRDPDVSPLYARLHRMPPALFTVGTLDPLIDDTLFLHARWVASGNRAELAIYPGAPHGFTAMPAPLGPPAEARIDAFLAKALT
jgi:acetyl esterase